MRYLLDLNNKIEGAPISEVLRRLTYIPDFLLYLKRKRRKH